MVCKKLIALLAGVVVFGFASVAMAGIPNLDNSTAVTAASQNVSVLVCPACDGDRLDNAQKCDGTRTDATITLTVLDINYDPVVGYPAVDMWLVANGMCLCTNGSIADGPTNVAGQTTFSGTLCAGGCSDDSSMNVYINPYGVLTQAGLDIWVNSPDMDCNLIVDLTDVVLFATAYYGVYDYCADFYCDGAVDLSDVVVFSTHYSHACP